MIEIDMKLPSCCDECFAFNDYGCMISGESCGHSFKSFESRMPSCPMKDAEPRVLTIETAYETECVWLEIARRTDVFPVRTEANKTRFSKEHPSTDIYKIGVEKPTFIVNDNYGKTWRCWSARPTDEQREATPWME